jgi:hypothetical protein
MSLIPCRTKRSSGMESGSLATLADFRNEMNRLFEGFFSRPLLAPSWFETAEPGRWLPAAVDPAKVTARYDKGVLTVELTKPPASASRKVPVLAS